MLQRYSSKIRDHHLFESFILGVIVLAGIVVGVETSKGLVARYGGILHFLDQAILWIFVAEIVIKIAAEGRRPWRYFFSAWNLFDFSIVVVCLLPAGGAWVAVIRLARILRALRLITAVPRLQMLVGALLKCIPSMFYVSLLLGIHFYVYAVMGTFFFRENDPGHFGDLGHSLLTLFRVVTLEDWTDVMYTAIYGSHQYAAQGVIPVGPEPQAFGFWAVLYFMSFVVVGSMVMINLFIGVILTSITDAQAEQIKSKLDVDAALEGEKAIEQSLERLETELEAIKHYIARKNEPPQK